MLLLSVSYKNQTNKLAKPLPVGFEICVKLVYLC